MGTFRIVISIPLAAAFGSIIPSFAAPVGFLLGAFPTDTLLLIVRRTVSQKFGFGDDQSSEKRELEKLQGVTTSIAETFADIGVTTLVQLAYDDPIQLAMRTNLTFYYVLDVASQALAANYLDLDKARKYSIRGAVEASSLMKSLDKKSGPDFDNAMIVLKTLATDLSISEAALTIVLAQISGDPCAKLQCAIWERT
jgi:hypothetical protein